MCVCVCQLVLHWFLTEYDSLISSVYNAHIFLRPGQSADVRICANMRTVGTFYVATCRPCSPFVERQQCSRYPELRWQSSLRSSMCTPGGRQWHFCRREMSTTICYVEPSEKTSHAGVKRRYLDHQIAPPNLPNCLLVVHVDISHAW